MVRIVAEELVICDVAAEAPGAIAGYVAAAASPIGGIGTDARLPLD
jgi:hypothetical protein